SSGPGPTGRSGGSSTNCGGGGSRTEPASRRVALASQARPRRGHSLVSWRTDMGKKLYVGNLAFGVTDADLQQMFGAHGTVQSAQVIMDRDTGRSKGFGFVEMGTDQEAQAAAQALNGQDFNGRPLTVNEARPKEGGGGGRGGPGGGGR